MFTKRCESSTLTEQTIQTLTNEKDDTVLNDATLFTPESTTFDEIEEMTMSQNTLDQILENFEYPRTDEEIANEFDENHFTAAADEVEEIHQLSPVDSELA